MPPAECYLTTDIGSGHTWGNVPEPAWIAFVGKEAYRGAFGERILRSPRFFRAVASPDHPAHYHIGFGKHPKRDAPRERRPMGTFCFRRVITASRSDDAVIRS